MEAAAKYIETLQNNLVVKIRTHGYPDKLKNCNNGNRRGDDYDSIRRAVDNYACQTMKWLLKISESRFDALRFIFHVDKKPYTINSINKVLTLLLFFKRLVRHSYISVIGIQCIADSFFGSLQSSIANASFQHFMTRSTTTASYFHLFAAHEWEKCILIVIKIEFQK